MAADLGWLPPHCMRSLQHLHGKNWTNALQIVDEGGVTCYQSQHSGRKVYQVGAAAASGVEIEEKSGTESTLQQVRAAEARCTSRRQNTRTHTWSILISVSGVLSIRTHMRR